MNIKILNRAECEVYFMAYEKSKPTKKEIHNFLQMHHPFFDPNCFIHSHPCIVCEKNFLLITVFQHNIKTKKKSVPIGYSSTATSLLVRSSYAKNRCTIQYENEMIRFDENPESLYIGDRNEDNPTRDIIHLSYETLNSLVEKEHIPGYRYGKKTEKSLQVICIIAVSLILLGSFARRPPLPNKIDIPVIQIVNEEKINGSFWETFEIEIDAICKTGGIINEYNYDAAAKPTHRVHIQKSEPGLLLEELSKTNKFRDVTIVEAAWSNMDYFIKFEYSASETLDMSELSMNMYADSLSFKVFCEKNGLALSEISIKDTPTFKMKIPEQYFPSKLKLLVDYCNQEKKTIRYLYIRRQENDKHIYVSCQFQSSSDKKVSEAPAKTNLISAFDIQTIIPVKNAMSISVIAENSIGKIQGNDNLLFVFIKSDLGKIHMREEKRE